MKKITLKNLKLSNFKGIKEITINFDEKETTIYGANGTGKTTISDSYTWLLYGKNSEDNKTFSIKPLDKDNNYIHNLESSVIGIFDVDGVEVTLQRSYRENWTKKRGSENSELTGHTTLFYINEVPVSLSEYNAKVENILSEELQKILSNPTYFNTKLEWKKRREILSTIVGEVTNEEILSSVSESNRVELQKLLLTDKTLDDYKREYSAKRKKIKDELDLVPSRIDEATKSIPESKDWDSIENQISEKEKIVIDIDLKIENSTKLLESEFDKVNKAKTLLFQKQQELTTLTNNLAVEGKKELNNQVSIESDIVHIIQINKNSIKQGEEKVSILVNEIVALEKETEKLREQLVAENGSSLIIDPKDCVCPTCSREYEAEQVGTIKATAETKFNQAKDVKILSIRTQGKSNNEKVILIKNQIIELENKKASLSQIITTKESELAVVKTKIDFLKKVEANTSGKTAEQLKLESEIQAIIIPEIKPVDNSELKLTKVGVNIEIDELKTQLHDKAIIEKGNARVIELNEMQKKYAQEISSFERIELAVDEFEKCRVDSIENKVNALFSLVKFKMFEPQLNGGLNATCKTVVDGVDYADLNTASKINSGVDIVRTLSNFYGISTPMFIDQKESVTSVLPTDSQMIFLIVDATCEKLKVI